MSQAMTSESTTEARVEPARAEPARAEPAHTEHARAEHAIEAARGWTRQAGDVATRAAERLPAGVVIVVGGTVLLAADAFGVGAVVTAGVAAYGAYRVLRRRARHRREQAPAGRVAEPAGAETQP